MHVIPTILCKRITNLYLGMSAYLFSFDRFFGCNSKSSQQEMNEVAMQLCLQDPNLSSD